LQANDQDIGKKARCPKCGTKVLVKDAEDEIEATVELVEAKAASLEATATLGPRKRGRAKLLLCVGGAVVAACVVVALALLWDREPGHIQQARDFVVAGAYEHAIRFLELEIQTRPSNAEAHLVLGECYLHQEKFKEAKESFNRATLLDPENREMAKQAYVKLAKPICKNKLRNLGCAIVMYCQDYDNLCPQGLDGLEPYMEKIEPDTFVCPADSDPTPIGKGLKCSYRYASGLRVSRGRYQSRVIVAYDKRGNHADGRHAVYCDGHVEWIAENEFKRRLQESLKVLSEPRSWTSLYSPEQRMLLEAFYSDRQTEGGKRP